MKLLSRLFLTHWTHLRVVDVDENGVEIRVLSPTTCPACERLWDTLTPVTVHGREVFPASRAERYNVFRRQAYVRSDFRDLRAAKVHRPVDEPASVARVRRFTDWEARRPLERY